MAIRGLPDVDAPNLQPSVLVDPDVMNARIAAEIDLHDGIDQVGAFGPLVRLDQVERRALTDRDQDARIGHARLRVGRAGVHDLERLRDVLSGRHVDPETIGKQGGVERCKMQWRPAEVEDSFDEMRVGIEGLAKASHLDPLGERRADRRHVSFAPAEFPLDDRTHRREAPSLGLFGRQPLLVQSPGGPLPQQAQP